MSQAFDLTAMHGEVRFKSTAFIPRSLPYCNPQPRHCNRHVFAGRLVMDAVYGNRAKARPKRNK